VAHNETSRRNLVAPTHNARGEKFDPSASREPEAGLLRHTLFL
jgi:hypothetical protein